MTSSDALRAPAGPFVAGEVKAFRFTLGTSDASAYFTDGHVYIGRRLNAFGNAFETRDDRGRTRVIGPGITAHVYPLPAFDFPGSWRPTSTFTEVPSE